MDVAKFIVGVLTIAIGLWTTGKFLPAVTSMGKIASHASKDQIEFSFKKWNKALN